MVGFLFLLSTTHLKRELLRYDKPEPYVTSLIRELDALIGKPYFNKWTVTDKLVSADLFDAATVIKHTAPTWTSKLISSLPKTLSRTATQFVWS
ncbi:Oxidoreductase [Ascosphaera pollenicola]|nr:Oxidoreductase [Ascosphaera pollenicola]